MAVKVVVQRNLTLTVQATVDVENPEKADEVFDSLAEAKLTIMISDGILTWDVVDCTQTGRAGWFQELP